MRYIPCPVRQCLGRLVILGLLQAQSWHKTSPRARSYHRVCARSGRWSTWIFHGNSPLLCPAPRRVPRAYNPAAPDQAKAPRRIRAGLSRAALGCFVIGPKRGSRLVRGWNAPLFFGRFWLKRDPDPVRPPPWPAVFFLDESAQGHPLISACSSFCGGFSCAHLDLGHCFCKSWCKAGIEFSTRPLRDCSGMFRQDQDPGVLWSSLSSDRSQLSVAVVRVNSLRRLFFAETRRCKSLQA